VLLELCSPLIHQPIPQAPQTTHAHTPAPFVSPDCTYCFNTTLAVLQPPSPLCISLIFLCWLYCRIATFNTTQAHTTTPVLQPPHRWIDEDADAISSAAAGVAAAAGARKPAGSKLPKGGRQQAAAAKSLGVSGMVTWVCQEWPSCVLGYIPFRLCGGAVHVQDIAGCIW
jgi:hypothetical protein